MNRIRISWVALVLLVAFLILPVLPVASASAQAKPRSRDLGIPFDGTPGPHNAITDVAGVEVGHTTLISGEGPLVQGRGPVRTGITAVLPSGRTGAPVFGAWFSLNGNGEMTGTTWLEESGVLEGPVLITNTHSVGVARDAAIQWMLEHQPGFRWALPVVAETYDGVLNDINGFHITPAHVFEALDGAGGGAVVEGSVGGGTGMLCNGFKGGIGTSSRHLSREDGGYTLGVLVQCNYGSRRGNFSGDIFVAFSTANQGMTTDTGLVKLKMIPNDRLDPLFAATVQATEEAVTNAMIAATTMTGADSIRANALPPDRLLSILREHNRLESPPRRRR